MASSSPPLSAIDLSDAPPDIITLLLGSMTLEQRCTCALVCADWAKAAAATTHSIVRHTLRDVTGIQQWLKKNGSTVKSVCMSVAHLTQYNRVLHISQLSSCTQLRQLSLTWCGLMGPDSLAANSMLQDLHLQNCSLSRSGGPVPGDPWSLVFPGPSRLPHLTSLVLRQVSPLLLKADLERVEACCSGLRRLELTGERPITRRHISDTRVPANEGLSLLTNLVSLRVGVLDNKQCSSLVQLTGLQELEVQYPQKLSLSGLRHLARLQQLTSLSFQGGFDSNMVSALFRAQLSDVSGIGFGSAFVNQAPIGSPPDVSAQLLRACDMAFGDQQQ